MAKAAIPRGYIEHMKEKRGDPLKEEEFVQVQQYSPYETKKKRDMAYFAIVGFRHRAKAFPFQSGSEEELENPQSLFGTMFQAKYRTAPEE